MPARLGPVQFWTRRGTPKHTAMPAETYLRGNRNQVLALPILDESHALERCDDVVRLDRRHQPAPCAQRHVRASLMISVWHKCEHARQQRRLSLSG
jgi:hypothetical protein